jgi:hypothetical protein
VDTDTAVCTAADVNEDVEEDNFHQMIGIVRSS